MKRDKVETREKILRAAERLLTQSGGRDFGINSLAREAGVDKVLIYRYYGSLAEVLRAVGEEVNFWPSTADLFGPGINPRRVADPEDALVRVLTNSLKELRRRKPSQEVARWELVERNELTEKFAAVREKRGSEFLAALAIDPTDYPERDVGAVIALLHAGLTHMVLCSRTADKYMGIDLHSNFGWRRLEQAINVLIRAYLGGPNR
jgi:AcrR family transcriptional regulator